MFKTFLATIFSLTLLLLAGPVQANTGFECDAETVWGGTLIQQMEHDTDGDGDYHDAGGSATSCTYEYLGGTQITDIYYH